MNSNEKNLSWQRRLELTLLKLMELDDDEDDEELPEYLINIRPDRDDVEP